MANGAVITTDELLSAMRMGTDYTFTIGIRNFRVPVTLLSMAEQVQISSDIMAHFANTAKLEERSSLNESQLIAKQTLIRASASAARGAQGSLILTEQLLSRMTTDEVLFLYDQYLSGAERLNPAVADLSDEKLRELVESAKKNSNSLSELSRQALEKLALYLLTPQSSPTDK